MDKARRVQASEAINRFACYRRSVLLLLSLRVCSYTVSAKAFFRLKEEELGTLKYEEFDHDYSSTPGRSYEKSDLHELWSVNNPLLYASS